MDVMLDNIKQKKQHEKEMKGTKGENFFGWFSCLHVYPSVQNLPHA